MRNKEKARQRRHANKSRRKGCVRKMLQDWKTQKLVDNSDIGQHRPIYCSVNNESNLISITTSDNADNVTLDENNVDFRCQQQESSSTEPHSNLPLPQSSLSSTSTSQLLQKQTLVNKTTKNESSKTFKKIIKVPRKLKTAIYKNVSCNLGLWQK